MVISQKKCEITWEKKVWWSPKHIRKSEHLDVFEQKKVNIKISYFWNVISSMIDIGFFIVFAAFLKLLFEIFSQEYDTSFSIKLNLLFTIIKIEIFCYFDTNIAWEIIGKYLFQNSVKRWKVLCQAWTILSILEVFKSWNLANSTWQNWWVSDTNLRISSGDIHKN